MTALPASSAFTGATTQTNAQTAYADQRSFLAGLLGTDGLPASALATFGAIAAQWIAKTGAYTVGSTDRGKVIDATSGTWTLSLLAVATAGAGFSFILRNSGTGIITLDPSGAELIGGATTVAVPGDTALMVVCTGAAWASMWLSGQPQVTEIDATAGRLLRLSANGGAFGLGNLGTLNLITDFDSITLPSGDYAFNILTTAGSRPSDIGAARAGILHVGVFGAANITQTLFVNNPSGLIGGTYVRHYNGTWDGWDVCVMRSSLLGTVAQIGGVPTGGVIERGNNANGGYSRFADGTLICAQSTFALPDISTAYATGLFRSSATTTWTFPSVFIAAPVVTGAVDDIDAWLTMAAPSTTTVAVSGKSGATKASANARLHAVGRWF